MVEASGLPGICRSKTGVADTEEPCTNRIVPCLVSEGSPAEARLASCLRHRKSLTLSLPARLTVQCAVPLTSASALGSARASSGRIDRPALAAAAATKKLRRDAREDSKLLPACPCVRHCVTSATDKGTSRSAYSRAYLHLSRDARADGATWLPSNPERAPHFVGKKRFDVEPAAAHALLECELQK